MLQSRNTEDEAGCGCGASMASSPLDVCTLSPEALEARLRWIRAEIGAAAVGRERLVDGVAIELRARAGLEAQVDEWIGLERVCCAPIHWRRTPSAAPDRLRIEIRGVDPDGALFADLPPLEDGAPRGGGLRRLLAAAGMGTGASLFVCCVLPVVLGSVFGATGLGALLGRLDDPLWIALGGVAGGIAAHRWLSRRTPSRAGEPARRTPEGLSRR